MNGSLYQRLHYWFTPLLVSVFVFTYQNCSDVGFRRTGAHSPAGGQACLPDNYSLRMSTTQVNLNEEVDFWVDPAATNTTYTWDLNDVELGQGTLVSRTFSQAGTYKMRVTAKKDNCINPSSRAVEFTIQSSDLCPLNNISLSGDDTGEVGEVLDYAVMVNCPNLEFTWSTGDGWSVTNNNNEMSHAWDFPGIFVVSSLVDSGDESRQVSKPVSIQEQCPSLDQLYIAAPDMAYINTEVPFLLNIPNCLNVTAINWNFGDGSSGSGLTTTHTYTTAGPKDVKVEITDVSGASIVLPHKITILSTDIPGCSDNALLTLSGPTTGLVGQSLRYEVFVPDCMQATAFNWNFDNGNSAATNPATQTFNAPGEYFIHVVVTTVDHGQITLHRRVLILAAADNYAWQLTGYTDCNCGGQQDGIYSCVNQTTNQAVNDAACADPKPTSVQACTPDPIQCPGFGRYVYDIRWDTCSATECHTNGVETAHLVCLDTVNGNIEVSLSFCSGQEQPVLPPPRACSAPDYPSCVINPDNYLWSAQYGACNCDGFQELIDAKCQLKGTKALVDPIYCQSLPKPPSPIACKTAKAECSNYSWRLGAWSECSATQCNTSGNRTRVVDCVDSSGNVVADNLCSQPRPSSSEVCEARQCNTCTMNWSDGSTSTIPHMGSFTAYTQSTVACTQTCSGFAQTRVCNDGALSGSGNHKACTAATCSYSWYAGSWSACSATACGTQGTQTRVVECRNQSGAPVAAHLCSGSGPQPVSSQACSARDCLSCTANWIGGTPQTIPHGTSVTSYAASQVACGQTCSATTRTCLDGSFNGPIHYQACNSATCPTYNWEIGSWSQCSSNQCGVAGTISRSVVCRSSTGQVVADNLCSQPKPVTSQACSPSGSSCTCPSGLVKDGNSCVAPIAVSFSRNSNGSPFDDKYFVSEAWYSFVTIPRNDTSFEMCMVKTPGDPSNKCINGTGWYTVDWSRCNQPGQPTCVYDGVQSQNTVQKTLRFKNLPGHVGAPGEKLKAFIRRGGQMASATYDIMPDVEIWLSKSANGSTTVDRISETETTYSFIKLPTALVNNGRVSTELCEHVSPRMPGSGSVQCNVQTGTLFAPFQMGSQSITTIYSQGDGATIFRNTNAPGSIGANGESLVGSMRIVRGSYKNGSTMSYSVGPEAIQLIPSKTTSGALNSSFHYLSDKLYMRILNGSSQTRGCTSAKSTNPFHGADNLSACSPATANAVLTSGSPGNDWKLNGSTWTFNNTLQLPLKGHPYIVPGTYKTCVKDGTRSACETYTVSAPATTVTASKTTIRRGDNLVLTAYNATSTTSSRPKGCIEASPSELNNKCNVYGYYNGYVPVANDWTRNGTTWTSDVTQYFTGNGFQAGKYRICIYNPDTTLQSCSPVITVNP